MTKEGRRKSKTWFPRLMLLLKICCPTYDFLCFPVSVFRPHYCYVWIQSVVRVWQCASMYYTRVLLIILQQHISTSSAFINLRGNNHLHHQNYSVTNLSKLMPWSSSYSSTNFTLPQPYAPPPIKDSHDILLSCTRPTPQEVTLLVRLWDYAWPVWYFT